MKAYKLLENEKKLYLLFLYLFFVITSLIWYFQFRNGILAGDDWGIYFSFGEQAGGFWEKTVGIQSSKYRPIINMIWALEYRLFGVDYLGYFIFNILLHSLTSVSLWFLVSNIVSQRGIPFVVACLYNYSHFALYNILQGLGAMEELCILLLVWLLYFMHVFYKSQKFSVIWYIILFESMLLFTHERFVVLLVVETIFAILFFNARIKKKVVAIGLLIAPFVFNYILKTFVFAVDYMVGTGGTSISINVKSILFYLMESCALLFGINIGPDYLNGYNWTFSSGGQKVISLVIMLLLLLVIAVYIAYIIKLKKEERTEEIKRFSFAIIFVGCLMMSYCLTIRVELRWVYAPYTVFIVYIGYILSKINIRQLFKNSMIICMLILSILSNWAIKENSQSIFFVVAMSRANRVYEITVEEYGQSLSDYDIYMLNSDFMFWDLGSENLMVINQFLDVSADVKWITSMDEIEKSSDKKLVIYVSETGSIDSMVLE